MLPFYEHFNRVLR